MVLTAGDCKLEYDRATGCYLDNTQMAVGDHLFSSLAQPSVESDGPFLPPPGPTYDEVLQRDAVTTDMGSAPKVAPASSSAPDTVFLKKSADQKVPQRNYVAQHIDIPEGPLSREELEYDDTDVKSGDKIQQYQKGQSVQVVGVC